VEESVNTFDIQPVAEPLTNDGREPAVLPWAEARAASSRTAPTTPRPLAAAG